MEELHIEKVFHDRYYTTYIIEGLSVKEMNRVLNQPDDGKSGVEQLRKILNAHGENGDKWQYVYGIHSIRHVGGHLIVRVGKNSD